jgi:hypothetical protein
MKNVRLGVALVGLLSCNLLLDCKAQCGAKDKLQSAFYPDTPETGKSFAGARPVSEEVAEAILRFDKTIKIHPPPDGANPSELFQAKPICLTRTSSDDLVVKGDFPMTGADNDWFWIVLHAHNRPKAVLWVAGNGVYVTHKVTRGYRDLFANWSSAAGYTLTWKYRFDGEKYVLYQKTEKNWK